jgi:hypothetical protein
MDNLNCKCGVVLEVMRAVGGRTQTRVQAGLTAVGNDGPSRLQRMKRRERRYRCERCGEVVSFDSIGGPEAAPREDV